MKRAIVFDGDDTLWQTERLYDEARQQAREVVEGTGLSGSKWEELERRIDVENVARFGHSVQRFPESCMAAYDALCAAEGLVADASVRDRVGAAAGAVFTRRAPLIAHARETLTTLKQRGYGLALLTKGDQDVQKRRIEQSGLEHLFDVIEIVEKKTPQTIASVLSRLGVEADSALSVGNSVRSDILPSLAAGVQAVWIDAHVWEYERDHPELRHEAVIEVQDLNALLDLVAP